MGRERPYNTNIESWSTILERIIRIPMNQREYSWTSKEVIQFFEDNKK